MHYYPARIKRSTLKKKWNNGNRQLVRSKVLPLRTLLQCETDTKRKCNLPTLMAGMCTVLTVKFSAHHQMKMFVSKMYGVIMGVQRL